MEHVTPPIKPLPNLKGARVDIPLLSCAIFGHEHSALPSQFGEYGLHRCKRCGAMRYPAIDVTFIAAGLVSLGLRSCN